MTTLLSNLRLKLLAIFFAAALWSVVAYTSNPTQSHKCALTLEQTTLPAGLVIAGDVPRVPVTVIGTAENLRGFDCRSLHVTGNFSNVKVGQNRIPISAANSDPTLQLDVPRTVVVTVDELGSSTLTVSIQRVKALLPGFHEQTNATTVTPASVRVEGPKSQLNGIQAVIQIDLGGLQAPGFNQTYSVVIWDANKKPLSKGFTVTPQQVTVKMVIQADAITVAKPVGWTLTGQPAAGYRVSNVQIAPLEVQATGLQNTLGTIVLLGTDPIDISCATPELVRTVTIRPPDGVTVNQKTAQVHVFIARAAGVSPSPGP